MGLSYCRLDALDRYEDHSLSGAAYSENIRWGLGGILSFFNSHRETERFQSTDELLALNLDRATVSRIASSFVIALLAGQDMIDNPQDAMPDRYEGFLFAHALAQPPILGG